MRDAPHDLVIRAGRVLCPATNIDGPGAVAVHGGRIAAVQLETAESRPAGASARTTLDFPDALLIPGMVDMHAHPALEGSKYGIDPDVHMLPRGSTTVLSQGDAGALNWARYRERVIERARTRVVMAINLAAPGESEPKGCFENLDHADVAACVRCAGEGGAHIWGVAVNVGVRPCGRTDPRQVLARGIAAAEGAERPLLFGTRRASDWSLDEQLELLRPGDVVTYCFSGDPEAIVRDGKVRDCVWRARERGILFDVGHGFQSFDFGVAEAAIAGGFIPDTISTDVYLRHVGLTPPHDLPLTVSKLLAAGLDEAEAWPRVTARPAALLGLENEIGRLAVGHCADLAVLRWNSASRELLDAAGNLRMAGCWEPVLTVRAGEAINPTV